MYDVIIIGGGLGGLTASIELARKGQKVLVIEKYAYPFHRVCGEYISNEIKPYFKHIGFEVENFGASSIKKVIVSSVKGNTVKTDLDLGAFGISRFMLDDKLYQLAKTFGVEFLLNTSVEEISKINQTFFVDTNTFQSFQAKIIIGAYGKRSKLDKALNRDFIQKRSPYIGIKYHIKTDFVKDTIAIHNFKGGFCGFSAIEDDKYCLCYLSERKNLRESDGIEDMQDRILKKNSYLKDIFNNSEFLFDKPLVINEINYESKSLIENEILMLGDAAGMIYPITGNGMSIAVRNGILLSKLVNRYLTGEIGREILNKIYSFEYNQTFKPKIDRGRRLQHLVGGNFTTDLAIHFFNLFSPAFKLLIKTTHGEIIRPTEYS